MSDGGSLEVSASRAGQLAEQARAEIDRLESQNTSISMQEYAAITNTLSSLRRQVKQTQSLSQREIVAEKRQRAKELASKLNEELTQLQQRCDRLRPAPSSGSNSPALHSQGSRASDMDTEELFRRTNGERATVRMDTSIQMSDRILQERDSMYRAASQIDDYIASGANTLSSLQNQRSTLKTAQRKLLDAANVIGLSGHVIRLIEHRSRQDVWILRIGVVVTLIIMLLAYIYLL